MPYVLETSHPGFSNKIFLRFGHSNVLERANEPQRVETTHSLSAGSAVVHMRTAWARHLRTSQDTRRRRYDQPMGQWAAKSRRPAHHLAPRAEEERLLGVWLLSLPIFKGVREETDIPGVARRALWSTLRRARVSNGGCPTDSLRSYQDCDALCIRPDRKW